MSAPDYAPKRSRRFFLRRSGRPRMLQICRRGAVNSLLAVIRLLLRTMTRSRSAELPCHWLEGNTDMIYIGLEGISLYFNQSGNFWRRIEQGPVVWRDLDISADALKCRATPTVTCHSSLCSRDGAARAVRTVQCHRTASRGGPPHAAKKRPEDRPSLPRVASMRTAPSSQLTRRHYYFLPCVPP